MVNSVDFTKRLEKILLHYGLSATAFSEKIAFNRSTISHLLSGRNKPSLEFVMKVVKTFEEVDLYWLLNGKGTFPSTSNSQVPISEISKNDDVVLPPISAKAEHVVKTNSVPTQISEASKKQHPAIDRIVIFYADGSFKEYVP